jgi:hypothetical protein
MKLLAKISQSVSSHGGNTLATASRPAGRMPGSKMAPTAYVMAAAAVSFVTIAGLRETAHEPLR